MAKMIKFDLSIGGSKVKTFEELQDNLHVDLLPYLKTGRLVKWFLSRELADKAEMTQAIDVNQSDLALMVALCEVLEAKKLDLSFNEFTKLPYNFNLSNLSSLVSLNLSHNSFYTFEPSRIIHIDRANNAFVSFPAIIGSLNNLISLDISYNKLLHLPSDLCSLSNLMTLNITGNLRISQEDIDEVKLSLPNCKIIY